jgi:hypothetical protein
MARANLLAAMISSLLAGMATPASAYNVYAFPFGLETGYARWNGHHAGPPGGVVTWSLMPTGTTRHAAAPAYIQGTSNLAGVFAQVGGDASALALIEQAFNHWEQVANIQFEYLGVDTGVPFAAPYAEGQQLGDIRIGGFQIDGFSAAVGFTAPPNGDTTLEGDILFNNRADISFYNAPGAEGDLYDLYPPGGGLYRNDFLGLVTHEIGHALGLLHSDVHESLMCGYVSPDFDGSACAYYDADGDGRAPINRLPDADDIAGIQFLYGPPPGGDFSADFDGNGAVDGSDFLLWQRGLGTMPALPQHGDANGDGVSNAADLDVWRAQFGTESAGGAMVAEPATGAAFAVLLALTVLSRRRVARLGNRRLSF